MDTGINNQQSHKIILEIPLSSGEREKDLMKTKHTTRKKWEEKMRPLKTLNDSHTIFDRFTLINELNISEKEAISLIRYGVKIGYLDKVGSIYVRDWAYARKGGNVQIYKFHQSMFDII